MSAPKPHEHFRISADTSNGQHHLIGRLRPLTLPLTFLSGPLLGTILVASIFGLPRPLIAFAVVVFGLSFAVLLWLALKPSRTGAKPPHS